MYKERKKNNNNNKNNEYGGNKNNTVNTEVESSTVPYQVMKRCTRERLSDE